MRNTSASLAPYRRDIAADPAHVDAHRRGRSLAYDGVG
jgi:hypothetical protein